MPVNNLKTEQFEELIENNKLVFIDFWAEWCAPCKQFAKIYEKIAKENPLIQFTKVNIEEESELAETFQIRSIPHLIIFKEGIVIYSEAGSMPESVLNDLVKQALNADVSDIRAKIDKGEL
ncbi:thioredoxin [Legionella lansingensis]|uniref:Thioredoxin n=1 Tax=Legionella lansingensis TaxID=45067 RepID=A0A0W0VRM6_9GAMM|nr:thioredoxin [Legionella lansingensis]KTD22812.1 thioredoxin [Legionella lansingensis]SNV49729.1 thioredoxin [Legionella lansingensis]